MEIKKIHDPDSGPMKCAALMSSEGTNVIEIIKHQKRLEIERGRKSIPYEVVVIFTDRPESSNAKKISHMFDIPVSGENYIKFCGETDWKNMGIRQEYERQMFSRLVEDYEVQHGIGGGYMLMVTGVGLEHFPLTNIHPAPLDRVNREGERIYTGDSAVKKMILSGENQLRSTTHLMWEKADQGPIFMISSPLEMMLDGFNIGTDKELKDAIDYNQDMLKYVGDHIIFPLTLQMIGEGRFGYTGKSLYDPDVSIYFDGKPVPGGFKLD